MNKGQISIDLLLALILFLVIIGFLLSYVNDFVSVSDDYQSNVSGFNNYIKTYDFVKSMDRTHNFGYMIRFDQDINFVNNSIVLDKNNNYIISVLNTQCILEQKACDRS